MKRSTYKTIFAAVVLILIFSSSAFADAVVSIQPVSTTVGPGSTATLDVNISGVSDLYAFQFDVLFGPATVSETSDSESGFLATGGSTFFIPGAIDNIGGSVTATADTLIGSIPGVNGDGTLATLVFTGLSSGTTSIDLANVILLDSNFTPISFSTEDGSVTVKSAVVTPEASSVLLLGIGLIGLAGLTRRKVAAT
jgi:hypothetical protein